MLSTKPLTEIDLQKNEKKEEGRKRTKGNKERNTNKNIDGKPVKHVSWLSLAVQMFSHIETHHISEFSFYRNAQWKKRVESLPTTFGKIIGWLRLDYDKGTSSMSNKYKW